jgi:hypothetical protein
LLSVLALSPSAFDPEFATPDGAGASTVTVTSVVAGGGFTTAGVVVSAGAETEAAGVEEAEAEAIVVGCTVEKKVLVEVLRISEVLEVTGGAESALVVAGGSGVLVVSGVVAGGVLVVAGVVAGGVLVVAGVVAGGVLVVLGGGGAAVVLHSRSSQGVSAWNGMEEKGSMDVYAWDMEHGYGRTWSCYLHPCPSERAPWDTGWSLARRIRPAESSQSDAP